MILSLSFSLSHPPTVFIWQTVTMATVPPTEVPCPNKSALSWTPGVKGGHVSDRQFAVSEDQTTALPV